MHLKAILLPIPESFETERLLIRVPREGDGREVNQAIRESLDELSPWMPWVHPVPTHEETEANLRQARAKFFLREDIRLHLYLRQDGSFVGSSGLHSINWSVPSFEIGYWVRTSRAGHGYCTEAVRGIARFGFEVLKANRIQILCAASNAASERVMIKAGFQKEACLRNERRSVNHELEDTLVYALTSL